MAENYSLLKELKHLMNNEVYVYERHEIQSFKDSPRFLGAILKDMEEKHHENGEAQNLAIQISHVTRKTIDIICFFVAEVRFLGAILKDMEEKHHENDEAKNLVIQISHVTHKTRDIICFFVAEVARQRDNNKEGKSILPYFLITEQIKPIEVKVMRFYDKIHQIQVLQDEKSSDGVQSMGNRTVVEEEITVGFDDEAMTIKEKLAVGKKQLDIISIVGMPGLGKTTLARKVYNDPYITHHFHIRAWTYVSQVPRKTEMLLDILHSVNVLTNEVKDMSNEKLGEKLYKKLKGKRYLIVIDDIWDIGAWDDLKIYLPNDNNGSRVMFTSRLKEVAMYATPNSHPHCLRFLTEEESWELFQWKVFQTESCPPELIEIGKQIMKKCEGLPLAIVVIAGLLAKNKKTQEWWKRVAQSVSSYVVSDPNQYLDTLALSYNHLPCHLKPCFLYLGAFPEDQEISVQKLIWLWIAEGFIQKMGQRSLEEVAEDYLMDLIQRSMVLVARKRFDGRIKACRMHDLLRDLCLKKAEDINFLRWIHNYKEDYPSSPSNYKNQCRLCIDVGFSEKCDQEPFEFYSPVVVQSILWFKIKNKLMDQIDHFNDPYKGYDQFYDKCSFILQTFKLVRVLDLWFNIAFFSSKITQLVNLRYLAINFRCNYQLPSSISDLSNLETLIICSNWKEVILPHSVWKISKLRHLYAKGRVKYSMPLCPEEIVMDHNHPSILENLQTISSLRIDGPVQDLLARTPYLTKLGIRTYKGDLIFPSQEFLRHLETLKLKDMIFDSTNLREVKFPANVKRLTLKGTVIKWEEISVLGILLHNLELLKLESNNGGGLQWATIDGGFCRLKFLKLRHLDVEQWITCSSHFPSLQRLSLECCPDLEEIPSSLGDILTLEMIELALCRLSAEESARKIKEEQENNGNNWLKVLTGNTIESRMTLGSGFNTIYVKDLEPDFGNLMFPNLETLKLKDMIFDSTNLQEVKFLANVKRLTLKGTGIKWEEISILGMLLPNLELLKLEENDGGGQQWATIDGGFHRLKFLKLKNLNVEQWITYSSHFPSLQHLSLEHCRNLKEIPSNLGDILTLQMIELAFCHPSILENLQTITKPVQDFLARIHYFGNLMFPILETLKLNHDIFDSTNLQEVKFLANVKRLTLKGTGIKWEEISVLGVLSPNLELLKLERNDGGGQQWATIDGGFHRLKFLKLKNLNVEQWITCSSHFPSLRHLSLEHCRNLKEIPSSLGDILTLEMIELAFCHPSAEESARKIEEKEASIIVLTRNTVVGDAL